MITRSNAYCKHNIGTIMQRPAFVSRGSADISTPKLHLIDTHITRCIDITASYQYDNYIVIAFHITCSHPKRVKIASVGKYKVLCQKLSYFNLKLWIRYNRCQPFHLKVGFSTQVPSRLMYSDIHGPDSACSILWHTAEALPWYIWTGFILGLRLANERRRYFVTTSLVDRAQT